jgi:hypothetical protein
MNLAAVFDGPDYFAANSLVWPLVVLLVALFVLRQIESDVKPIVSGMVSGLAAQSSRHAASWAMALLMASAASCQALGEVATDLGWVYAAALAKVLQPGLVAVIAYVMRSPTQGQSTSTGNTTPPISAQ